MDMINKFNSLILPKNVAPIAAKGGRRRKSKKRSRKHKKNNKSRTRSHR